MSNFRNMNQAGNPAFWDFVASLQNGAGQFPFGQGPSGRSNGESEPFDGHFWGPFGPMPHRGRRHGPPGHGRGNRGPPPPHEHEEQGESFDESFHPAGPHGHPRGPPPPPGPPGPPPPGPHDHHHGPPHHGKGKGPEHHPRGPPPPPELEGLLPPGFEEEPTSRPGTPPTPPETPAEDFHHPRPHHHRGHPRGASPHGRGMSPHHHRRGGGRFGGRGAHGPRGGRHGGPRRGPGGPHGPDGPGFPGFPFDLSALAEAFAPGLFNNSDSNDNNDAAVPRNGDDGTFNPDVDVFDTASAYIIHASVPGAKKSDLDITYSASRNSVTISGVVTRPGVDEEMMSALALDERKVGAFEREIKLDEKVKIDEDNIGAKLEDGILNVRVPKINEDEEEEYVTVKKIALE